MPYLLRRRRIFFLQWPVLLDRHLSGKTVEEGRPPCRPPAVWKLHDNPGCLQERIIPSDAPAPVADDTEIVPHKRKKQTDRPEHTFMLPAPLTMNQKKPTECSLRGPEKNKFYQITLETTDNLEGRVEWRPH